MQPTLPLDTFIERCKFCDHQLDGRSKHFCTTCLPPLSQWADRKDYAKHYRILICATGLSQQGLHKCRIPSTHPAYIHPPKWEPQMVQKNCRQCGTQFECKPNKSFCSPFCRNIASSNKTKQNRLTRIQIQADKLFPPSDVDLTAFAALIADFLSKQTHIANESTQLQDMPTEQEDALLKCTKCQEPFTQTGRKRKEPYCNACLREIRHWYYKKGIAPEMVPRACVRCSTTFQPKLGNASKYCSTSCARVRVKPIQLTCRLIQCVDCSTPTKPRRKPTRCARCQFITTATRKDATFARRRHIEIVGDKGISWRTVGARDSWICHLCSKKVPQQPGKAKRPKGATVDHLIPLARGGLHVWANVGLAHRDCNMSRSTEGIAQLKLVS